jgi:hypothetical protein
MWILRYAAKVISAFGFRFGFVLVLVLVFVWRRGC